MMALIGAAALLIISVSAAGCAITAAGVCME